MDSYNKQGGLSSGATTYLNASLLLSSEGSTGSHGIFPAGVRNGILPPFFLHGVSGAPYSAVAAARGGNFRKGDLSEELWQACAGSLVYVPKEGETVWYFPQGHMEQVAASTMQQDAASNVDGGSHQQPPRLAGLPSQILCRVFSRVLTAEVDTDEVYAQLSLIPEARQVDLLETSKEQDMIPPLKSSSTRVFTKILTASDTSTHGGFSVLRKHAEECLPPLDMSQETPCQDLKARDLHGYEWSFRHTYRGHPRRHLLTTGWSVFVSHKKLVAGDAVIFLRGETGELRVGIRRAKQQQSTHQALMSSQSMHMGVLASASHALGTRTMFSVFYKPRTSCSTFLVPTDKFAKAMSVNLSVEMRFKMRFEIEDGSDRSYDGTIVGIEDVDPLNWVNSKWRCLKVNWDEINNERPKRVCPWEIEVLASSPVSTPPIRSKRYRSCPSALAIGAELSGLGSGVASLDGSKFSPKVSTVLQGQEAWSMGMDTFWKGSGYDDASVHEMRSSYHHGPVQKKQQQCGGPPPSPPLQVTSPRSAFYTPFLEPSGSDLKLSMAPSGAFNETDHRHYQHISPGYGWVMPSNKDSSSGWHASVLSHANPNTLPFQYKSLVKGNAPSSDGHLSKLSANISSCHVREPPNTISASPCAPPETTANIGGSGCKLFGVSLTKASVVAKANTHGGPLCASNDKEAFKDEDHAIEQKPLAQVGDCDPPGQGKLDLQSEQRQPDAELQANPSVRSRVKVIKKGSQVGRGIDLTRFKSYYGFLKELEAMFNMEGELIDRGSGWQVAYTDSDGDTMKVGDDPWPEFCRITKKLYILSPEEMHGSGEGRPLKQAKSAAAN